MPEISLTRGIARFPCNSTAFLFIYKRIRRQLLLQKLINICQLNLMSRDFDFVAIFVLG